MTKNAKAEVPPATEPTPAPEAVASNPEPAQGLRTQMEVPEHLRGLSGGNEQVTDQDKTIPVMKILQSNSPEVNPAEAAKFIKGAGQGMILLTGGLPMLLEGPQTIVDVFFTRLYTVFKNRDAGGGWQASFGDVQAAESYISTRDDRKNLEIQEAGLHFILLVVEGRAPMPAVVYFKGTGMKYSRQINDILAPFAARFSKLVTLTPISEKNAKGSYWNMKPTDGGWLPANLVPYAKKFYEDIAAGRVKAAAEKEDAVEAAAGVNDDDVAF